MKLHDILVELIDRARQKKGRVHGATLSRGLRVHLWAHPGGRIVRLWLSRPDIYPSDQEWQTVANHFPGGIPEGAVPIKIEHAGRCWLKATWTRETEG